MDQYEVVVYDQYGTRQRTMYVLANSLDNAVEWGRDWVRSLILDKSGWSISAMLLAEPHSYVEVELDDG